MYVTMVLVQGVLVVLVHQWEAEDPITSVLFVLSALSPLGIQLDLVLQEILEVLLLLDLHSIPVPPGHPSVLEVQVVLQ